MVILFHIIFRGWIIVTRKNLIFCIFVMLLTVIVFQQGCLKEEVGLTSDVANDKTINGGTNTETSDTLANNDPFVIEPNSDIIVVGETIEFKLVEKINSQNDSKSPWVSVSKGQAGLNVVWTIEGEIGTISEDGKFNAEKPGSGKIIAKINEITIEKKIEVMDEETAKKAKMEERFSNNGKIGIMLPDTYKVVNGQNDGGVNHGMKTLCDFFRDNGEHVVGNKVYDKNNNLCLIKGKWLKESVLADESTDIINPDAVEALPVPQTQTETPSAQPVPVSEGTTGEDTAVKTPLN